MAPLRSTTNYYRSYLVPLEKYGLVIPHDLIEEAWNQIWNKGYVHEVAAVLRGQLIPRHLADRPDDGRIEEVVELELLGLVRQVR